MIIEAALGAMGPAKPGEDMLQPGSERGFTAAARNGNHLGVARQPVARAQS